MVWCGREGYKFAAFLSINLRNTMEQNVNVAVLDAAFRAWNSGAQLRKSRLRNKRFAYGDQWGDVSVDAFGNVVTDW